jgi:V8-like Glu-specific endopeptidase
MATNGKPGDGHRNGAVRDRSQFQHPNGHWYKRDQDSGQIIDVNQNRQPHKGVRREK